MAARRPSLGRVADRRYEPAQLAERAPRASRVSRSERLREPRPGEAVVRLLANDIPEQRRGCLRVALLEEDLRLAQRGFGTRVQKTSAVEHVAPVRHAVARLQVLRPALE